MLKERNNLDYEYFNRYLANCGSLDPSNMELINDFFKEKLIFKSKSRSIFD